MIIKKYTQKRFKIIICAISALFEWKECFGSFFHIKNNYSGKTAWANEMKFCTHVIGLDLHQTER
jgi:hypothetical protein